MTMILAENWSAYSSPTDMWQASDPSLGPYIPSPAIVPSGWSYTAQVTTDIAFAPSIGFGRNAFNKVLSLPFLVHTITDGVTPIKVNSGKTLRLVNKNESQASSRPQYYAGWFKISNFNSAPAIIMTVGEVQSQSLDRPVAVLQLNANGQLAIYRSGIFATSGAYSYDANKRFLNHYDTQDAGDLIGASSAGVITANTWHFLEVKTVAQTFPSSLMDTEVRIDNVAVITAPGVDIIRTAHFDSGRVMRLCHLPAGDDFGAGLGVRTTGVAGSSGVVTDLYWDSVFMHEGVNSVDGFAGPSTVYALKTTGVTSNGTGPPFNYPPFTSTTTPFQNAVHTRDLDYARSTGAQARVEFTHEPLPIGSLAGEIWAVGTKLSATFENDDVQIINSGVTTEVGMANVSIINTGNTAIFRDNSVFYLQQLNNTDWTTEVVAAIETFLWHDS
jgi:hypothetical protein